MPAVCTYRYLLCVYFVCLVSVRLATLLCVHLATLLCARRTTTARHLCRICMYTELRPSSANGVADCTYGVATSRSPGQPRQPTNQKPTPFLTGFSHHRSRIAPLPRSMLHPDSITTAGACLRIRFALASEKLVGVQMYSTPQNHQPVLPA